MRYISLILIFLSAFYVFSFAKHCLKNNNKMAAAGAILLGLISIVFPIAVMFLKFYV